MPGAEPLKGTRAAAGSSPGLWADKADDARWKGGLGAVGMIP